MGLFDFLFRRPSPVQAQISGVTTGTQPIMDHAPAETDRLAEDRARRDQSWGRWLQSLKHRYDLVPGAEAEAAYEAARARGQVEGFCALIVQPGFDAPVRAKPIDLKDSKVRAADEYFATAAQARAEETDDLALFDGVEEVAPGFATGLYLKDLLSSQRPIPPFNEVAILQVPCARSWMIPLYLHVGPPLDQSDRSLGEEIGVERHWFDRFGAELCCVGDYSWQFRVARPARTHAEAVELLREHYLYDWLEGTYDAEAIAAGAANLRVETHWSFFGSR
ncbi:DUF4253 domain-containing protein [Bradyrhizobium canariense]|uniref:DUF4253 domain-containing protein n=1 Tax=Bradyrhizobium canariense TaxID=255045 RepID=UPI001B8A2065|nr:DUF4253 domain-containing protein [Bradyrhizobium canariense]MBR0951148.1 DUF4253 domain-containing protein [Bradyrhizobium canariense]